MLGHSVLHTGNVVVFELEAADLHGTVSLFEDGEGLLHSGFRRPLKDKTRPVGPM